MSNYDRHAEAVDEAFSALAEYQPSDVRAYSADDYVRLGDFRQALETAAEYETNPINRFRVRRFLRNERALRRFHERFTAKLITDLVPIGGKIPQFDFQSILDYLVENWDEILKLLLTILPLFI